MRVRTEAGKTKSWAKASWNRLLVFVHRARIHCHSYQERQTGQREVHAACLRNQSTLNSLDSETNKRLTTGLCGNQERRPPHRKYSENNANRWNTNPMSRKTMDGSPAFFSKEVVLDTQYSNVASQPPEW